MRMLLPERRDALDLGGLVAAYAYPPECAAGRPWLRANMVATLDGSVVGGDGSSRSISTPADRQVFTLLRGLADVVLVGAGTARAERYRPLAPPGGLAGRRVAQRQRPAAAVAVVSTSLDLDPRSPLLTSPARHTIVLTCGASPADRREALAAAVDVVVAGEERVDLPAAVAALASRGLTRILCEGGPVLLGGLAAAGLLDELCLTWSPVLAGGDGGRILTGPPVDAPMRLAHLLEQQGTLLGRWVRP